MRPKMSIKNPAALYLRGVAGFVNYSNSIVAGGLDVQS